MCYELNIPPRVLVGADSRNKVGREAISLGWSRVLVVTDPFHAETGRASEIARLLNASGLEVVIHSGINAEPDTEMVEVGMQQFKADRCDGIVALGGGSVIDAAKTISVLAANGGNVKDYMGNDAVPVPGAGVIALPTTSGTGSEATRVVVIADSQSKLKMSGRSRAYLPKTAILDYKLTMSMPGPLTAATGIDALTHAIEAYVSRRANDFTDLLAMNAIKLIWDSIRRVWQNGNDEIARRDMLVGSFQAGIAFSNSSVGLVHSMSEPLGACFHVPHGLSNAMLLPAVTEFSVHAAPERYARITRCLNHAGDSMTDEKCCLMLIDALTALNRELEIHTPKTFGIDRAAYEENIEKMADDAASAGSTANNPAVPAIDQIKKIYSDVYEKFSSFTG